MQDFDKYNEQNNRVMHICYGGVKFPSRKFHCMQCDFISTHVPMKTPHWIFFQYINIMDSKTYVLFQVFIGKLFSRKKIRLTFGAVANNSGRLSKLNRKCQIRVQIMCLFIECFVRGSNTHMWNSFVVPWCSYYLFQFPVSNGHSDHPPLAD